VSGTVLLQSVFAILWVFSAGAGACLCILQDVFIYSGIGIGFLFVGLLSTGWSSLLIWFYVISAQYRRYLIVGNL
jgi:hypothetical protein